MYEKIKKSFTLKLVPRSTNTGHMKCLLFSRTPSQGLILRLGVYGTLLVKRWSSMR